MNALMERPRLPVVVLGGVGALLLAFAWRWSRSGPVQVKMLPFDNKSEFQVMLDLPEGATLETSAAVAADIATYLRGVPEVHSTQTYAGTAAPFNFNGLVRHYFLRRGSNVADVQVNLVPKERPPPPESRDRGCGAPRS